MRRSLDEPPARLLAPRLALAVLLAPLVACARPAPADGGAQRVPEGAVARIGDRFMTTEELQERINRESSYVRLRYSSPEKKREYLDNLIKFEVLAVEAERRGFGNDPDIVRLFKQQMVARMLQKDFEPQHDPAHIPEEEVRAYVDAHPGEFDEPEERRVVQLVVPDAALARKLAAASKRLPPGDEAGFAALVRAHSTDAQSREHDGNIGFLTAQSPRLPPEILRPLFAARQGEVVGPFATTVGHVLLRVAEIKPAVTRDFATAAAAARGRLFKQRRSAALKAWVDELRARTDVTVFEENLPRVQVDTSDAPARDTSPPLIQYLDVVLPGNASGDSP